MSESRPPILDYAMARRWCRRTANRESLVDFLKSMRLVVPLTVLIWYFAANEQMETLPGQFIPFTLKSADPNHLVRVGSMGDETIVADFNGPRNKLDYVKEELGK